MPRTVHPAAAAVFLLAAVFLAACSGKGGKKGRPDCLDGYTVDAVHEDTCVAILPPAACPAGTRAQVGESACLPVGNTACAAGFVTADDGWGCGPILPAAPCPAGSRPAIGNDTCVAVGWSTCASPFVTDPSGWGCIDQAPAAACPGATRATLDGRGCVPIGDCAAAFPPAAATHFVDATFSDPQLDATHFRILGDALALARSGDVVAIAPGTYVAEIATYPGVKVVGKCAAEVILDQVPGSTQPGVLAFDGKADVSGITLRGHLLGAAAVQGGTLTLTEVLIEGNLDLGVLAADPGSSVTLRRSVIRGTRPSAGKVGGFGVNAEGGSRVVLEESEIVDSMGTAIFALHANTTVEVTDSLVWKTLFTTGGTTGHGVTVQNGASATLRRSVVAESRTLGLYVSGRGSSLVAEQSVVRDTRVNGSGQFGVGVQADSGGSVSLTEVFLLRSAMIGLLAFDTRTQVTLDRVSLFKNPTAPRPGETRGIVLQRGPTGTFTDLAIVEAAVDGLIIAGAGANANVTGLLVQSTHPGADGSEGQGVWVVDGGRLILQDAALLDNRARGFIAQANGAEATLEAVLIEGTLQSGPSSRNVPIGLDVADGTVVTCRRCVVRKNQHIAVRVTRTDTGALPATLTFEDGVISDHQSAPDSDDAGAGLIAYLGGTAIVSRTTLARNSTVGLMASSEGAQLSLSETTIKETRPGREPEGSGLVVQVGAAASVSSVAVVRTEGRALWVQGLSTRATITDSLFGDTVGDKVGIGVTVQDAATLDLLRSEVRNTVAGGVANAFPDATLFMDQTFVHDVRADPLGLADGVIIWSNARATLNQSVVQDNAAIGVAVVTAQARLNQVEIRGNTIGLHVTGGTRIETGAQLPSDTIAGVAFVADSCIFIDNASRTGTGAVAVPDVYSVPLSPQ